MGTDWTRTQRKTGAEREEEEGRGLWDPGMGLGMGWRGK